MLKWIQGGLSAAVGIAEPEYGKEYIHSCTDRVRQNRQQPYKEVTRKDLCWLRPNHTNVETVTFYYYDLNKGIVGFAQIIHSNVIGLHITAQFTFRMFDCNNPDKLNLWTSTKLENFNIDGTNFYADDLSVELNKETNQYHFVSKVCPKSEVDIFCTRLAPGCKLGDDPTTYFGDNVEVPWGTMRHLFWPRNHVTGTIIVRPDLDPANGITKEKAKEFTVTFTKEKPGMCLFIMACQGMKPHHAARSWNFLGFQGKKHSAVYMEFTTPKSYDNTVVSIGIVADDNNILSMTIDNKYEHLNTHVDDIGWSVPEKAHLEFNGFPSTLNDKEVSDEVLKLHKETQEAKGTEIISHRKNKKVNDITSKTLPAHDNKFNKYDIDSEKFPFRATADINLSTMVERVDVMNEIPQFVKNIVSGVVGTKPYIYTYSDNKNFSLNVPGQEKEVGFGWAEITYISEVDALLENATDDKDEVQK